MTSSWQPPFYENCIINGSGGIRNFINYTLYMVGGTNGGPVTNTTWDKSFHGPQEIVVDKYQLCAKDLENDSLDDKWLAFTVCLDGEDGIGICTIYNGQIIESKAKTCAVTLGYDFNALHTCVHGPRGTALYKASVFHTSNEGIRYDAPGLPVVRINGKIYKGLDAYRDLGKRICSAYTGPQQNCGCGKP